MSKQSLTRKGKRIPECHPEQPYYAKGLCVSCWHKNNLRKRLEQTKGEPKKIGRPLGAKTFQDTRTLLRRNTKEITEKLIEACRRPNPSPANLKLYFDLSQEKSTEEKIELSADEYFIIRREAIKRALPGNPN